MKFISLSFQAKVLSAIAASAVLCTAAAVTIANIAILDQGKSALLSKSKAILRRSQAGTGYVAEMGVMRDLVRDSVQKYPDGNLPEEVRQKIFKSVPIVAGMRIAKANAEADQYSFRVAAAGARNPKNEADREEAAWIQEFSRHQENSEKVVIDEEKNLLRVIAPVRISQAQGCLHCHGDPSTSPWKNGKDVLGYALENMKEGDIKAIFIVSSSLEPVKAETRSVTGGILIGSLFFTLLALLIGYFMVRRPIRGITEAATRLDRSAHGLGDASQEISVSSKKLSGASDTQAAALTQTAAALEQITAMIRKTSDNANESAKNSQESYSHARQGVHAIQTMVADIDRIAEGNHALAEQVKSGNQEIAQIMTLMTEIDTKTKVIDDIVFQTRLLSFNASVEAARAGEHGKGFSVVAEEIGNLAAMSGRSSAEISTLLVASVKKVQTILETNQSRLEGALQAGEERIVQGRRTAAGCEKELEEILRSVQVVDGRIGEIARAASEQTTGVNEINKAVMQLNQASQMGMKISQETHSAATVVGENSETLQSLVSELREILDRSGNRDAA